MEKKYFNIYGISIIAFISYLFFPSCKNDVNSNGGLIVNLEIPATYQPSQIDSAIQILQSRVQNICDDAVFNISQDKRNINLELPLITDSNFVQNYLLTKGELNIYETFENKDILKYIVAADRILRKNNFFGLDSFYIFNNNLNQSDSIKLTKQKLSSIFLLLYPPINPYDSKLLNGSVIGNSQLKDTSLLNKILNHPSIIGFFPKNLVFAWCNDKIKGLSLISISKSDVIHLTKNEIKEIKAKKECGFQYFVNVAFNDNTKIAFERFTLTNKNREIAVLLDNSIIMHPVVFDQITSGNFQVFGNYKDIYIPKAIESIVKFDNLNVKFKIKQIKVINGPNVNSRY